LVEASNRSTVSEARALTHARRVCIRIDGSCFLAASAFPEKRKLTTFCYSSPTDLPSFRIRVLLPASLLHLRRKASRAQSASDKYHPQHGPEKSNRERALQSSLKNRTSSGVCSLCSFRIKPRFCQCVYLASFYSSSRRELPSFLVAEAVYRQIRTEHFGNSGSMHTADF
jgi:hypothetical protein